MILTGLPVYRNRLNAPKLESMAKHKSILSYYYLC